MFPVKHKNGLVVGCVKIVKDEVWQLTGLGKHGGILCVQCCAARLGRPITLDDLDKKMVNDVLFYFSGKAME